MQTVLGAATIGLLALAVAWSILRIRAGRLPSGGCVGALISTGVVAAAWHADAMAWLWRMPQVAVLLWIIATILIFWNLMHTTHTPSKWCGVSALVLNGTAFLAFMWTATVSASGV